MSGATAGDYAWLHDAWTDGVGTTVLCINLVRGLSPADALRRIKVTPGTSGEYGVAAYTAEGGTVLAESGWATKYVTNVAEPLSLGTAVATVFADINGADFTHEVNEQLITTFSLYSYRFREGNDPDRFLTDVRELGLYPDDDEYAVNLISSALALASRTTGVRLSRSQYARPTLTASTDHLYPSW
ncbi:hypothetical protein Aph01nite_64830 [Acrocarpospora phusangensis]|uniref:Uncharacterized protein n=1 Tax=Acrocarpospora phusangensis TaxID=1070424 RepID=A0A919US30_9ACTN|nr:DUF6461 domain-containing protein [Acrocarpospora phusangensis]GIH28173.1 hypothetical protein Aph01nite_64830 [Acrocarpospora phusangensis]